MTDSSFPDLKAGVALAALADGAMLRGQVDGEDAILLRQGDALYAIGAQCTHYHAELRDGLLDGNVLHCPMHHAQFDVRSGEALCAPALDPLPCWRVDRAGGQAFVRERIVAPPRSRRDPPPADVVIVGGGAAGLAAADMLRREGYAGRLALLSADVDAPVDRPNLSKDFLAGTAPADWMPLRGDDWYAERNIELLLNTRVAAIDVARREVRLEGGATRRFDALLLATGADPVQLAVPGAAPGQVQTLRTFADGRAIAARAASARSALVIGASFIGLEVAASLRSRGLEVHVVAPEKVPMERVLGEALGRFVHDLHVGHGVEFHLGATVAKLDGANATLTDGSTIAAHAVVLATGVSYRSLGVAGADDLTGRGVYYGSAMTEAAECADQKVFIVGGANSAGQAAVYFARYAGSVHVLVRGPSLEESMSHYLIEQLAAIENIVVRTHASAVAAEGNDHLHSLRIRDDDGERDEDVDATFVFIGAAPRTDWLDGVVGRDARGFILAGSDAKAAGFPLKRDPYVLETTVPGVFVAGDVRARSIKRVASAVGEGSMAVSLIHEYLAE